MKEHEICTSDDSSDQAKETYRNMLLAVNNLSGALMRLLKPYNLSQQQYNVLKILQEKYPQSCTLSSISNRMVDKMSNATRLVDKLLGKKLVTRSLCPDNHRKVDIRITAEGLELLEKLDPEVNRTITSTLGSKNQIAALNELLKPIITKE